MMYYKSAEKSEPAGITIRLSRPTDTDELGRVAQRDSRPLPDGELLIAAAEGEIRAAISVSAGEVIADPFHRTEDLLRMLVVRREQMQGAVSKPRRGLRRLRLASG
jgi:hypothetical protein